MEKNKGGRPTKLTPELILKAQEYLNTYETVVPTIEGLSLYLGVNRDTLYDWDATSRDAEFSDILSQLKAKQASELIDGTLRGKYNATIAKLILSGRHNYVEKREQEVKVEMPKPILGGLSKDEDQGTDSSVQ